MGVVKSIMPGVGPGMNLTSANWQPNMVAYFSCFMPAFGEAGLTLPLDLGPFDLPLASSAAMPAPVVPDFILSFATLSFDIAPLEEVSVAFEPACAGGMSAF